MNVHMLVVMKLMTSVQKHLIQVVDSKVEELDSVAPQLGVRDYLKTLSDEFDEDTFDPLDEVWEDEIRRLFDKFDSGES